MTQTKAQADKVKQLAFAPMQPIKRAALALHEGDLEAAEAHLRQALEAIKAA